MLPSMVIYVRKTNGEAVRLGITVGKKLGGAVSRNRAKRIVRELFRKHIAENNRGFDVCVVARSRLLNENFLKLSEDFCSGMAQLGISCNEPDYEKDNN